jgi:hypothetical protein
MMNDETGYHRFFFGTQRSQVKKINSTFERARRTMLLFHHDDELCINEMVIENGHPNEWREINQSGMIDETARSIHTSIRRL